MDDRRLLIRPFLRPRYSTAIASSSASVRALAIAASASALSAYGSSLMPPASVSLRTGSGPPPRRASAGTRFQQTPEPPWRRRDRRNLEAQRALELPPRPRCGRSHRRYPDLELRRGPP